MCRSDSGADTRDSENTFPASKADERKKNEPEEEKKQTERGGKRKLTREANLVHYLCNSPDSNSSSIVCFSLLVLLR